MNEKEWKTVENMTNSIIEKTDKISNLLSQLCNDDCFCVLLELCMVSDPWPLSHGHEIFTDFLDDEARRRGFCDWIEAYHKFIP